MVEPDSPEALAAAITRLAADPPLRLQLATAAQLQLREYSWEARAGNIMQFIAGGGLLDG